MSRLNFGRLHFPDSSLLRYGASNLRDFQPRERPADWKSAVRQSETLRYLFLLVRKHLQLTA